MANQRDTEINRQISQICEDRMMLRDELEQMRPKTWKQDATMNEVPVYSPGQHRRQAIILAKLAQLDAAEAALYRL